MRASDKKASVQSTLVRNAAVLDLVFETAAHRLLDVSSLLRGRLSSIHCSPQWESAHLWVGQSECIACEVGLPIPTGLSVNMSSKTCLGPG